MDRYDRGTAGFPNSSGTAAPNPPLPAKSCDAHFHVLDARFAGLGPCPRGMTLDDYERVAERLGTQRAVFVQAKHHGTDNRCMLDAIARMGDDARGIAVVRPDVGDDELSALHDGGVRGLRFSLWNAGDAVVSIDDLEPLAARIRAFGWHVQLHMTADQIVSESARLRRLPCDIVFDHMGRLPPERGTAHPAFEIICSLAEERRGWVKLSGAYLNTRVGAPHYPDASAVARVYLDRIPDRLVWGSDWPHTTEPADHKPDDAGLCDLLFRWAGEDGRRRVLVTNPAELYGF